MIEIDKDIISTSGVYGEDESYAVRWAQRQYKIKLLGYIWTKWHWTNDSNFTLCGCNIPVGKGDNLPLFPETNYDGFDIVECKNCRRKLGLQ